MDNKANIGLAGCLSNVFKLAEVEGLKWVRYVGPNSSSLETPKVDPVLTSYAKLLSEGYACSWSRLSPSTDGVSGEGKDLWVFYFTKLPDLSQELAPDLREESVGSWENGTGMSTESSAMLFRALNGLIERSLLTENFLPLGKWFARPDPSMGSDGRGCFLCNFSFFIYAHLYICASVDVRAGPALQPLLQSHLHQALASSSGMQVILSPSGLNAIMTGHSYQITDPGIEELLDEWKLFYPLRFAAESLSQLPAAVEVVLGGVRLRYPSQFVFVYHSEGSFPTPPPSPIDEGMTERVIQGGWEETTCVDPLVVQKECENCSCTYHTYHRESHSNVSKPSRPHRLMSNSGDSIKNERSSKPHRYRPYSGPHPTDNATPMREQPVPSSLNLSTSVLSTSTKRPGPPKYATPLPSPAVTLPHSPALKAPMFPNPHFPISSAHVQSTPPPPAPCPASSGPSSSLPSNTYNISQVADLIMASSNEKEQISSSYNLRDTGWWQCLYLPDSLSSMQRLVSPTSPWATGFTLLPNTPHGIPGSPNVVGGDHSRGTKRVKSSESQFSEMHSPSKRKPGNQMKVNSQVEASLLDTHHPFQDETIDRNIDAYNSASGTAAKDPFMMVQQQLEPDDGLSSSTIHKPGGGNFDLTSESAVKISGDLGELFDDSDDEDVIPKMTSTGEMNHFSYPPIDNNRNSKMNKMNHGECHPLPDLSHIYPTPPSVESTDDKFDEGKCFDERNEIVEANLMIKLCPFDDVVMDIIPDDFKPLNGVCNTAANQQMKNCVYIKAPSSPINNAQQEKSVSSSNRANSEPQKFIFPPPSSLIRNTCTLSLPLSSRDQTMSPLLSTPFTALPSASPSVRGGGVSGRLSKRFSSVAQTPAESPFDPVTPTPMSGSRLMPLLPEAHALYISLALLDSALAANVSDNVAIDFSAFQSFMMHKRNSWRTQLDSVSSSCTPAPSSAIGRGGGDNDSIFNKLEDEKPLMMVGIADYPSLGFKEDIIVTTPAPGNQWNQSSSSVGLPCLSEDEGNSALALEFVSIIQDYCLHLCLTGKEEASQCSSIPLASTPVALHPYQLNQQDKQRSKQTCRLYHTHSVSSAIVCGKHLVNRSLSKLPSTNVGGIKQLPSQPSLDKEDNSAAWILDLLALPTNFVTKKLRELKTVFQNSFHHAPCIKVSTKGPLTLKDLQTLTPSQSLAGDDCLPLPMHPLVVGYDHEWMSVSPLSVPTWDKLLFEPYSSPKHIMYLVVCPGGETTLDTLVNFFRNLSITYKTSRLGCHVPLDKGEWDEGIVTGSTSKRNNDEKDEKTMNIKSESKKEVPSSLPSSNLQKMCKEAITPFLLSLPPDKDKLLENTSHDVHMNRQFAKPLPVFIVLYIVMKESENRVTKVSGKKDEVIKVMKAMSSLLSNEQLPDSIKSRIVIQPLDESELIGHQANSTHNLRTLAFSVFSRCSPNAEVSSDFHHLTGFGPISARPIAPHEVKVYYPLYILSSDPLITPLPLSSSLPSSQRQQSSSILFAPEESTLFCSYCVTADKRWLVSVVCDRQAELLDTTVIGLPPNDTDGSSGSRTQALQKLWLYLISKVSSSILTWNIVITRLGKPSSAEIKDWTRVIYNDGLMTANQLLKGECDYCAHSTCFPSIKNVIIVSVQPERNIQLFPSNDVNSSVSHVLVLPPRPNSLPAMTPAEDGGMVDFETMIEDFNETDVTLPGNMSEDLFIGLNEMDIEIPSTTYKEDVRAPLATGYLISTTPPGNLPTEFWGHDKPQSMCHMFKTLLHSHLSVHAYPGSPPDVLCSVLLAFDALSWLSINHVTQQRNSSLPIHLFLLSKLYNFFTVMSR